jgi:TPR repeat protein
MEYLSDETPADRLYLKGLAIRYERHFGLWMPIMWHLALRGHTGAMIELADWFSTDNSAKSFGTPADPFSAAGLYRRAHRKGDARAANNAAMSCFNRNDMTGYRRWLGRAAKAGDPSAGTQLRNFETRLWHAAARKVGRLRPEQKRDEFA